MIQRKTRDYEVSLWSLQDSLIAILKQYGLEFKGQIEEGKLTDKDDGTQTFSFKIPMYYYRDGEKIENPAWYNVETGKLIANMRKIKVIFNKDDLSTRKIYQFLIIKVSEQHADDNSLYCFVECEGLAFHELGKIGYKISLSAEDFYNDDYDYITNGYWIDSKGEKCYDQPLATLQYWNDRVFSTVDNWDYEITMNWDAYSLQHVTKQGVLEDYAIENDIVEKMQKRESNKVYEQDFIDSWELKNNKLQPAHVTYAREKARVSVDVNESNIYNITQTLAETFGVFCKYEYQHNENCQIIKRKVVYYNNYFNEAQGVMDISYPYQTSSIKRNIDSTDLVTKLFVKTVEDSNTGSLSIIDVGANDMGEDYLLNFDYLHEIGGITDEQYASINDYKVKIKKLNLDIAPVSAKVIALQSQLVKLEAELTTRKNAIARDTEQLLSNTALLDAITNGQDILTISGDNPQTATLLLDTSDTEYESYYIKITQQGVYPETIKLYRSYVYNTRTLSQPLTTGEIVFDDAGEVVRIRKLFLDPNWIPAPKTVYITYSYRPKLYYERVVSMWQDRLNEDQTQREILEVKIAQLKYSLYGEEKVTVEEMKKMDVTNLFDLNVYDKYLNLLQEKANAIKEFNAIMGPALREGYWQPENYNDYGDQYNDRFNISLQPDTIDGSTKNTVFSWDDVLFEGEQDVFYNLSAAEYKQAYQCIDLTTPNGKKILELFANSSDRPISYIYTPRAASEDRTGAPNDNPYIEGPDSIIYIPGLLQGDNWKIDNINFDPQIPTNLVNRWKNNYSGKLNLQISSNTWGYGYTRFLYNQVATPANISLVEYTYDDNKKHDITYKTNNRILQLDATVNNTEAIAKGYDTPHAQLKLNSSQQITLEFIANNGGDSISKLISVRPVTANYEITTPVGAITEYNILESNTDAEFNITYKINAINNKPNDLAANLYTWRIIDNKNNRENTPIQYIYNSSIYEGSMNINNKIVNYTISSNEDELTLSFDNSASFIQEDSDFSIFLKMQTPMDLLSGNNGISANEQSYSIKGNDGAPIITVQNSECKFILSTKLSCTVSATAHVLQQVENASFSARWYIGDTVVTSNNNITYEITYPTGTEYTTELTITINQNAIQNEEFLELLNGAAINVEISYNNKLNTKNIGVIEIDREINIIWPETVTENNTSLLNDLDTILLDENAYSYNIQVRNTENATQFTWQIIPTGRDTSIFISSPSKNTDTDLSQAGLSNRYAAELITDENNIIIGSQLEISIPAMSDNTNLRDNGTKVRCICSNSTNSMILPARSEEQEDVYQTITVAYPIQIISKPIAPINWWPMNKPQPMGEIQFSLPTSIINSSRKFSYSIVTYGPYDRYTDEELQQQILSSGDDVKIINSTDILFNFSISQPNANTTTGMSLYILNISGNLSETSQVVTNIIEQPQDSWKNKYLYNHVTITYGTNSTDNITQSLFIPICIKTSGPQYTQNNAIYTSQQIPPTEFFAYTLPTDISIKGNSITPELILSAQEILKLNMASVETITWGSKVKSIAGNNRLYFGWDQSQELYNNETLAISRQVSQGSGSAIKNIGLTTNIPQNQTTPPIYCYYGIHKNLYIIASNPYGKVYSKIFNIVGYN